MLRIAEQWHGSDLGLQRQGNEDNYFVRAPLFVVADGMGGAQAGEVASEMAVESFDAGLPDGESPADGLVRHHRGGQPAHPRALARPSSQRAGHGHDGHRRPRRRGHGDGRPRRRLALLPRPRRRAARASPDDHSLVGELVRRGKLTEEQAESHPQRSVITRALGPEPSVQVDVIRSSRPRPATCSWSARTA